jgi:hypothetical protein
MSSRPNIHSLLVAANLFQLEAFPLKWRVLMAMATKTNKRGVSWISAAKICIMLGEVDSKGQPTPEGMKAVRASRQALTKSGILTYFTEVVDAEKQHRWKINLHAFKPGYFELLSKFGSPEDIWSDAPIPEDDEEESEKPSKIEKVEEPEEVEEVYEEYDMYRGSDGLDYLLNIDGIWYETGSLMTKNRIAKPRHVRLVAKIED